MMRSWLTEVEPETVWQPERNSAQATLATEAAASIGRVIFRFAFRGASVRFLRTNRCIVSAILPAYCLKCVAMDSQCSPIPLLLLSVYGFFRPLSPNRDNLHHIRHGIPGPAWLAGGK